MEQDKEKESKKISPQKSSLIKIIEEMVRYIDTQDLKEDKK